MLSSDEDVIGDLNEKNIFRHLLARLWSENKVVLEEYKLPLIYSV